MSSGGVATICQYYCAVITFISFFFFGLMIWLETQKSEYLLREFQHNGGAEDRIRTLSIVIAINFVLFLIFVVMIKRGGKDKD